MSGQSPTLSVVIPCYNEEETVRETHRRLVAALEPSMASFELVFVDDGSRDRTRAILRELAGADARVRVIGFSRNFGHQLALTAGIDAASGDAVALIDADLQDPPELIPEMLARWREGFQVIYGRRLARDGEPRWKTLAASVFYRLVRRLADVPWPVDTGDFRLMDRAVVDVVRAMPERVRVLRAMSSWVGFRQTEIAFRRPPRFAGAPKYNFFKLCALAISGVVSSSLTPLRAIAALGGALLALGVAGLAALAILALAGGGWAAQSALLLAIMALSGLQIAAVGIVGLYVGAVYGQVQGRPLYVVAERLGFAADSAAAHPGVVSIAERVARSQAGHDEPDQTPRQRNT
jgi:dolichol-phosphate mannosyltransferase